VTLAWRGASVRVAMAGAVTQLRESAFSPLAIVETAVAPLAYGVVVIAGYGRPTGALLLGCVAAGMWGGLYTQSTLIVLQERAQGTLSMLAAGPIRLSVPLAGRLLAAACQSLAAVPIIGVAIVALFGEVHDFEPLPFVAAFVPVALGIIGCSLLLMGALIRYRYSAGMVNGLFSLVVLIGGFFVPTSAMPFAVRVVGSALPSAWAIQAIRPAAAHRWTHLGIAAILAIAWVAAGIAYVSGAQRRLRKIGFYEN
jgi:ABC-type multidrug transport system permease subunit